MGSINEQSPVTTAESESSCDSSSDLDDSQAEHVNKVAHLQEQIKAIQDQMRELVEQSSRKRNRVADRGADDDEGDIYDTDDSDYDEFDDEDGDEDKYEILEKRAKRYDPSVTWIRVSRNKNKKKLRRLRKLRKQKQRKQSSHKKRRTREESPGYHYPPMSLVEKVQLTIDVGRLTDKKVSKVIRIVQANEPAYRDANPNNIGIDFDTLKDSTLRKVEWFVSFCLRKRRPYGRYCKSVDDMTPAEQNDMMERKAFIYYLKEIASKGGRGKKISTEVLSGPTSFSLNSSRSSDSDSSSSSLY